MPDQIPLIPLEHFFDNPERALVRISPDGSKLAFLAPEEGRLNVWVRTVGAEDDRAVTHDHERGIPTFLWSRDGSRILYLQDKGGNENYLLYVVDVDDPDAEVRCLTPFEDVRVFLLDAPRETPHEVLIQMNKRNAMLFDPYRLNIETGEATILDENPGDVGGYLTDADGRVRGALAQTATQDWQLRVRDTEDGEWRVLAEFSNADECQPIGFTPDGAGIWIGTARDAEFARLCRVDIATGELTVVDADEESDLVGAVISDQTNELVGAVYIRDRVVFHPFDEAWARDWKIWTDLHPGDPGITGMTADENTMIITYDDDRDPGATYVYDRTSGKAEFLWRSRPKLNPDHLSPMTPVSYPARDGLTIRGYLTTPRGMEATNLPMVVLVHGGPWARDMWGYDPEAQFLANRGYAVLQINYRGSTGFGKSFKEAAVKQFAGAMHDDLIDGVEWAVEQGIADRERIGIYGGSYGGYAALVGVTFTPDVFAAAVSYVGPSSLVTLVESFPPYAKPFLAGTWFKYVGDPEDPEDRADMEARSPLFKVDQITTPLMVVQGANDPRVTKKESDQIVEALRARGVDVEYIVKENEGHGFSNPENKLELYAAMERFFAEHLGGRAATS